MSTGRGFNNAPFGALVGALLTGLPLYIFMEKKIEERTERAVMLKVIEKDLQGHKELSDKMWGEHKGKIWTMEQDLKRIERDMAVMHANDSH